MFFEQNISAHFSQVKIGCNRRNYRRVQICFVESVRLNNQHRTAITGRRTCRFRQISPPNFAAIHYHSSFGKAVIAILNKTGSTDVSTFSQTLLIFAIKSSSSYSSASFLTPIAKIWLRETLSFFASFSLNSKTSFGTEIAVFITPSITLVLPQNQTFFTASPCRIVPD